MADPFVDRAGLEDQTIAAHRAYLDALTAWEQLVEAGPTGLDKDHAGACEAAEAHKETCRIAFRDLADKLGHIPRSHRSLIGRS